MRKKAIIFLLLAILLLPAVSSQEASRLLSNSQKWQDVYSVMLYGNLINTPSQFLVSDRHGTMILDSIPKTGRVRVISSNDLPFIRGYESILRGAGIEAEELTYENVNLELARQYQTRKFVIVDDSYGYNAIAVASYAVVTKSFVLFADKQNIQEIDSFLQERVPEEVIIYGQVDREVARALGKYEPETINKNNDRFLNNVEIVKKYQAANTKHQAILTNGEFIEQEIMSGSQPVLFIGTNNVPDAIKAYIQSSDIEVGVLIGNELVGTATVVKREVGISVFVKFAQSARQARSAISQVEALDMFYLPVYRLNAVLVDVKYNKATSQLEVTLRNTEDQAVYFKGAYSISEGGESQTTGDTTPLFLDANEVKTVVYDISPITNGATIDVYIVYGESPASMEKVIDTKVCPECDRQIQTVEIYDDCKINITSAPFNPRKKQFSVELHNLGEVSCYADAEIVDLVIAGIPSTYGAEDTAFLGPSDRKTVRIRAELLEEDYVDNEEVRVRALYGEREGTLIKVAEKQFPLVTSTAEFAGMPDITFYILLVIIVIVAIFIFWRVYRKTRERIE